MPQLPDRHKTAIYCRRDTEMRAAQSLQHNIPFANNSCFLHEGRMKSLCQAPTSENEVDYQRDFYFRVFVVICFYES